MNDQTSGWVQFALIASAVVAFLVLLFLPMVVCWRKIARIYPDGPFTTERLYYSVNWNFGRVEARGYPHHLAVGKQGLRLFAIRPFRRLCPPILIPWEAVYDLQGKPSSFGCDSLFIEISGVPFSALCFRFLWRHGKAISLIQRYWEEHRAAPKSPAAVL